TVGALFPPHCAAVGKAAIAHLPEREIDSILSISGLTRYTPFTLTHIEDVKENLREAASRGYALDQQELERGLSGVAAPVRTREGRVIAAVGMTGPTPRFRGKELAQKIALTKEIAAKLSASLGNFESAAIDL